MKQTWIRFIVCMGIWIGTLVKGSFCFANWVDYIVVEKEKRIMKLFEKGREIRSYKIALGKNPIGKKEKEGDMRTPEGRYLIDFKQKKSKFHLALHISYPNRKDKIRANQKGAPPGGDIMIHGLKKGWEWLGERHTTQNWTRGCIAVTNPEIEEIWKLVRGGTVVEIRP